MTRVRDVLDGALGRVSMYRVVTLVLVALTAVMLVLTATGVFTDPFTVPRQLATLAVLLGASYASNRLCGVVWRVTPHGESSVITALLLFMLFWPSNDGADLAWLAVAALLANLSKYLIAWRGRHVLNPAAAGAFLVVVAQDLAGREATINATWWIAAERMLPFVAVGALVVLWRTRRLDVAAVFVAVSAVLVVVTLHDLGQSWADASRTALYSYPIVFLAGFMLSEPLTLPPRRRQQWIVALVTALAFSYPLAVLLVTRTPPDLGLLNLTPELALLIGNLVAFGLSRRSAVRLDHVGRRHLGGDVWEFAFAPRRPVDIEPGQYLELHLPHRADRRGVRRAFSVSSPAGADHLTVAVRVPERSSSFKRALVGLDRGASLGATGVVGDFVWPRGDAPLALVAGGIGVTPFVSQLLSHPGRDVVLVYGVPHGDQVPYADELAAAGVPVVLVSATPPTTLPAGWTHIDSPALTSEVVARAVPDLARRVALVSGPPAMVNAVRPGLRRACRRVLTDYFSGY